MSRMIVIYSLSFHNVLFSIGLCISHQTLIINNLQKTQKHTYDLQKCTTAAINKKTPQKLFLVFSGVESLASSLTYWNNINMLRLTHQCFVMCIIREVAANRHNTDH